MRHRANHGVRDELLIANANQQINKLPVSPEVDTVNLARHVRVHFRIERLQNQVARHLHCHVSVMLGIYHLGEIHHVNFTFFLP
jgi:hypothetical protein